jgi:hypothetical protein
MKREPTSYQMMMLRHSREIELDGYQMSIYFLLMRYYNMTAYAHHRTMMTSYNKLKKETGFTEKRIKKTIDELVALGEINIKKTPEGIEISTTLIQ